MIRTIRSELGDLVWVLRTLTLLAVAGAIYRELRLPPEERTWHGRLLGIVPYDFRMPTLARLREAYFDTGSDRLLSPRPIGVGWALNVAAVLKRLGVLSAPGSGRRRRGSRPS